MVEEALSTHASFPLSIRKVWSTVRCALTFWFTIKLVVTSCQQLYLSFNLQLSKLRLAVQCAACNCRLSQLCDEMTSNFSVCYNVAASSWLSAKCCRRHRAVTSPGHTPRDTWIYIGNPRGIRRVPWESHWSWKYYCGSVETGQSIGKGVKTTSSYLPSTAVLWKDKSLLSLKLFPISNKVVYCTF